MTTIRQIERLWDEQAYARLARTLLDGRTDVDPALAGRVARSTVAAAALALIRLDEMSQNARPLCSRLVRALIAMQQPDGGWGDVAATVLAIRALRCARGDGVVIARGLAWLADLQKDEGAWPAEPIRRLAADPVTTAFVLLHLAGDPALARAARIADAADWLERHRDQADALARPLAARAVARARATLPRTARVLAGVDDVDGELALFPASARRTPHAAECWS